LFLLERQDWSMRACLIATRVSTSRTRVPRTVYFGATSRNRRLFLAASHDRLRNPAQFIKLLRWWRKRVSRPRMIDEQIMDLFTAHFALTRQKKREKERLLNKGMLR